MFNVTMYDLVVNLAYLLFLVGFALKDVLWLRVVVIVAALVEMLGRYYLAPEPLWTDIVWCVFYIAVNAYQFTMILRERSSLRFTDEERHLYKMVFNSIPELQYKKLLNIGEWRTFIDDTILVDQGTEMETLIVIYDGLAKVEVDDAIVSYLRNGNFVGEMSFLTGNLTTASVTTLMPTHCIMWNKQKLRDLMHKEDELRTAMHSVFSGDLLTKLIKHTSGANDSFVTHEKP